MNPPEHSVSSIRLEIKRLDPRATLPAYQSDLAAGMDLSACVPEGESVQLIPIVKGGKGVLIKCGFAMSLPAGFEAQVRPRSGLASKFGVTLPNAPGTIDADYRGEVMVPLINLGQDEYQITHGLRIAQMIIGRVQQAQIHVVTELSATTRGVGGFGSTGGL